MNNDFFGHSWCDLPMIFTRDFVTRENHWQIASLVTQKSLFTATHALFFISLINMFAVHPICIQDSICQMSSMGPGNDLACNKKQDITSTNADHYVWHHLASLGHTELRQCNPQCIWIFISQEYENIFTHFVPEYYLIEQKIFKVICRVYITLPSSTSTRNIWICKDKSTSIYQVLNALN